MKKITKIHVLLLALIFTGVFSSCQDESYVKFTANSPVYMSYDELRVAVKSTEVQPLENPGKIYFKDNYLYINEYMKGIHVYDNTNPASPQPVTFINIPGNIDIVIRNNFLYADSYIDLVVIDIADVHQPKEIDRKVDVFEYTLPEYDDEYELATIDRELGVVIEWEIKEVKERIIQQQYYPIFWDYRFENMSFDGAVKYGAPSGGGSEFGVGGSMARFGQFENYLMVLKNSWAVTLFDVTADGKIVEESTWNVGWNIETMFIRDQTMFIGSQQGMFIYDLSNLPAFNQLSRFLHFTACDPVVADENYAYITLRTGGICGGGDNVLQVVDVRNLTNPQLKKTYQLKNPYGLGIDGDVLFVCDGTDGLKVYDATQPAQSLPLISHFKEIHSYDVIPLGTVLFMVGEGGFAQYDYSDLQNITLLSKIEIVQE